MTTASPRSFSPLLTWLLGLAAVGVAAAALLSQVADRVLRDSARQDAVKLVQQAAALSPAVVRALESGRLDAAALHDLHLMQRIGEVARFALFDREGRRIAVPDEADRQAPTAATTPLVDRHAEPRAALHEALHTGLPVVKLLRASVFERMAVVSETYVPVLREGRAIGVVEIYADDSARVRRIRGALFETLAVLAGVLLAAGTAVWALARSSRQAQSRWRSALALDALTGLPHHAQLRSAIGRAIDRHAQGGIGFALLAIDIDGFAALNDRLGHAAGDELLRQAAQRLRALARADDMLARLGGDQFALLMAHGSDAAAVREFGTRVIAALCAPFALGTQSAAASASVGAARIGVDAYDADGLLHCAAVALRRAKTLGSAQFGFYDPARDRAVEARRALAHELRRALEAGTLALHYQPQFDTRSGHLCGYEALMRWPHPLRGMVSPGEFIPLAEETGLIEALGAWALQRACAEARDWPPCLTVSVNLSAAQFHGTRELPEVVAQALRESGLPAARLEVEITESLLMRDTALAQRALTELSGMGVRIALDDFGTGYSSLAYLWRFPLHKIKIDRAFTHGLGTDKKVAVIVRGIIAMAHSMGLRVNAEGVENEAQRAMLQQLGCEELQGFLLGRPTAADTLAHDDACTAGAVGRAATNSAWTHLVTAPAPL